MKNKISIFAFLVFFASFGLYSCQSLKHATSGKAVLTEKQKFEEADLFARAISLKETGKLHSADSLLQLALQINPDDAAANFEEAQLLAAFGKKKQALLLSTKAKELDTLNIWYNVLYANLSKENGNYTDYVHAYEQLNKIQPENENFVQELALAYSYIGDYAHAVKAYVKLEDLVGVQEFLTQKIAALYLRLGEKEKALAEYEKLIQSQPEDTRPYALLAEFASKNDFPEKAEWGYHKIIELNSQDPYVHISLADFYRKEGKNELSFEELKQGFANTTLDVKTKINLVINYYSGKLTDEQRAQALELAEIIKETHPNDALSDPFYASMLYENKKYSEARLLLQKIVLKDPNNYPSREQLLFCNLYLEDYHTLIIDADKGIAIFPTRPIPYLLDGIGNFQLKNYEAAKNALEKGKILAGGNQALTEQFYSTLGDTYYELKMKKSAYKAYDEVLKLNPKNAIVLNNYAYYLSIDNQQLDKAAQMAKQSVDLDPYNQNNLDTYAWVLYQQKEYGQALTWEEKALNNGGKSSGVVVEHYGDILYRLGRKKEALQQWQKAKKLKDHSDLLNKKIKYGKIFE